MLKVFSYIALTVALTLFLMSGFWFYFGPGVLQSHAALSPIPDFLMVSKNNQVRLLDLWSPVVEKMQIHEGDLAEMTAQSVLMYDLTTDKVLYEKEAKVRRPMASITKIMTAIIAIENRRLDDKYLVRHEDIVGEDSMGVRAGEVYSFQDLLYGLMLPSGNDAAEVFAHNYPSGREGFIKAMNNKAESLGLVDTHFTNPSGLQGDGEQYTTTYDLLVITRYALEHYPIFAHTVATSTFDIAESNEHGALTLVNETNLLTTYPGVKGVKTGYTPEAGMCLVTYLDYGGHKIIGIMLNSENRRGEMKELLDYSLKSLSIEPPPFEEEQ